MKRENKILLSLLAIASFILLILIISKIHAEDNIPGMPFGLSPETIEKAPQTPEEAKNVSIAWIKKNWAENLRNENSFLGKFMSPILKGYDKISPYTNPIFKFVLGVEPGVNWLFILTLVLWISFIIWIFRISSVFSLFSKRTSLIISFGLVILMSMQGITKKIAEYILNFISLLTSWWMQLIAAIAVIVILVLLSIYSEQMEAFFKELRERKQKAKIENEIEELKSQGKSTQALEEALAKIGRASNS